MPRAHKRHLTRTITQKRGIPPAPLCGVRGLRVQVTRRPNRVTCRRCLSLLSASTLVKAVPHHRVML